MNQIKEFKPLTSTGGQNQYILLALFALGAVFGIDEGTINNIYLAAVPVVMVGVDLYKRIRLAKPQWNWNIISYAGSAVVLTIPALAGIVGEVQGLLDFVKVNGFTTAIFGMIFPLINQILAYIKSQKNKGDLQPAA